MTWLRSAASVGIVALLAACGTRGHVLLPPTSADPTSVVRVYAAALSAHDITTAKRLMTRAQAERQESYADSEFRNVVSIENLVLANPRVTDSPPYRYAVFVPAEFDLRQREEMSMPNGHNAWGYTLVRDSPTARWLINGEGPLP